MINPAVVPKVKNPIINRRNSGNEKVPAEAGEVRGKIIKAGTATLHKENLKERNVHEETTTTAGMKVQSGQRNTLRPEHRSMILTGSKKRQYIG